MKAAVTKSESQFAILNKEVTGCVLCPRLVAYREQIGREKRRAYMDWEYWAKPVPGFATSMPESSSWVSRPARMVRIALDVRSPAMAPIFHVSRALRNWICVAAQCHSPERRHEAQGRIHHRSGPLRASVEQAHSRGAIKLLGVSGPRIGFVEEHARLGRIGKIGFDAYLRYLKRAGSSQAEPPTSLATPLNINCRMDDISSPHTSVNADTNTGKLTERMFAEIFRRAARLAAM